ncbi:hypothetical protein IQ260_10610 [Leptolyngbya cf. ectocarpi LEGE 11479]|uniref:Uncharacterized protein n=1 Tax=Leptolyngbya cf. ectocarpi LEGE 11479 TaxID=1828722 RepID=A0A928ZTD5_LEPEC|nr:hypothetical protein [Leptolyngbya ectocarpi]MBE9067106.1 hypothetical protein [Leptolyngbya cf. ectocarpi LEGE 11479]
MSNDVLILTIYFLVVIYVLYQMALAIESNLEDKVKVDLDRDALANEVNRQLTRQTHLKKATASVEQLEFKGIKLPPFLAIQVPAQADSQSLRQIRVTVTPMGKMSRNTSHKSLKIEVHNLTADAQVYVDWDKSSIATNNSMQRAVRTGIPMGSDLSRGQILSVVNPGDRFNTEVTGENCLSLNADSRTLEAQKPLIDMEGVITKLSDPLNRVDSFDDEELAIVAYSLRLMVGVRYITERRTNYTAYLLLPFDFVAVLLPDEIAFPPLRWLLNRPRPENARDALTTLLLGRPSKR